MDLTTFTRESALNREAYERLRAVIQRDFAGQYVALAHGKIVGAAGSFDEARRLIESNQPVPEYFLIFPAEIEPDFGLVYDLSASV
jgi:hypothetical protein